MLWPNRFTKRFATFYRNFFITTKHISLKKKLCCDWLEVLHFLHNEMIPLFRGSPIYLLAMQYSKMIPGCLKPLYKQIFSIFCCRQDEKEKETTISAPDGETGEVKMSSVTETQDSRIQIEVKQDYRKLKVCIYL